MLDYLSQLPDTILFLALNIGFIIFSIVSVIFVYKVIPFHVRLKENAVIGTTASLIAVIYGVLAGLSALYLINNNSYTSDAVQREASAVADVYRDSRWLKEPTRNNIQVLIKKYLNEVIVNEWPYMRLGKEVPNFNGSYIIDQITLELIDYNGVTNSESLLVHDIMDEIRTLYDARQKRIHMSESQLSPELWLVIIIGSILTLCINFLFGMNVPLHIITICAAAIMVSSMLFLLITLDRPFQGEFVIEPDVFLRLLHFIEVTDSKNPINAVVDTKTKG